MAILFCDDPTKLFVAETTIVQPADVQKVPARPWPEPVVGAILKR
jgi:hypothetical protein